jgi:hypothetical protein
MVDRRCAMTIGGSPAHQGLERGLHLAFGLRVERGGGLVEDQDRRVLEQRPGDRQALALAAGKAQPALADQGVQAFRQLADEAQRVCGFRGRDDVALGGAVHRAVGDVRVDGIVEQHDLLADERDVAAQAFQRQGLQVVPVEEHAAARGRVEPRQQVDERGLAAARAAHQREGFSRCTSRWMPESAGSVRDG